jgi:hypothetical protein
MAVKLLFADVYQQREIILGSAARTEEVGSD